MRRMTWGLGLIAALVLGIAVGAVAQSFGYFYDGTDFAGDFEETEKLLYIAGVLDAISLEQSVGTSIGRGLSACMRGRFAQLTLGQARTMVDAFLVRRPEFKTETAATVVVTALLDACR